MPLKPKIPSGLLSIPRALVEGAQGLADQDKSKTRDLGSFVSTAYGPPWNAMQGTGVTSTGINLRDGKQKYVVAVDPQVIPYHTKLKISPNPFGDANIVFAAEDTGGAIKGKRIDFFVASGRAAQNAWGRRSVRVQTTSGDSGGLIPGFPDPGDIPDALGGAGDALGTVARLLQTLLNPTALAGVVVKVYVFFWKLVWRAFWQYVLAPPWHWVQRAVSYYFDEVMSADIRSDNPSKNFYYSLASIVTILFWSIGYAILWARAEDGTELVAEPKDTILGRTLRVTRGKAARRKLTAPGEVDAQTATKPPEVASTVSVKKTRSVAANRKRAVTVTRKGGENGRGNGSGSGTGTESSTESSADLPGRDGRRRVAATVEGPLVPN